MTIFSQYVSIYCLGIALRPSTPLEAVLPYLDDVDQVRFPLQAINLRSCYSWISMTGVGDDR